MRLVAPVGPIDMDMLFDMMQEGTAASAFHRRAQAELHGVSREAVHQRPCACQRCCARARKYAARRCMCPLSHRASVRAILVLQEPILTGSASERVLA